MSQSSEDLNQELLFLYGPLSLERTLSLTPIICCQPDGELCAMFTIVYATVSLRIESTRLINFLFRSRGLRICHDLQSRNRRSMEEEAYSYLAAIAGHSMAHDSGSDSDNHAHQRTNFV